MCSTPDNWIRCALRKDQLTGATATGGGGSYSCTSMGKEAANWLWEHSMEDNRVEYKKRRRAKYLRERV
jgi:hypothetical protein